MDARHGRRALPPLHGCSARARARLPSADSLARSVACGCWQMNLLHGQVLKGTGSHLGLGTAGGMRLTNQHTSMFARALASFPASRTEDRELSDLRKNKGRGAGSSPGGRHSGTGLMKGRLSGRNQGSGKLRQMTSACRFVNSRGDVSSVAAVLHAALGIRMYMYAPCRGSPCPRRPCRW